MQTDTAHSFDWAHDAFVALNDIDGHSLSENWPAFSNADQTFASAAFTIPPSLISQASIERYGQITPPDELSPAAPKSDTGRESSIPVEQLQNEVPWPMQQQIQSLANYEPEQAQQHPEPESQSQSQSQESEKRASKRRRTSKNALANQSDANPTSQEHQPEQTVAANPQPPKRKRGRPKSQPQTVEAYTADGFPFQVASARQSHLEKNRVAAHKCRQRKKEYIGGLETRAREYSAKNKALKDSVAILREEVLQLKNEVLRHAGCNFWAVDEYLARCAGDLLGVENPSLAGSRTSSQTQTPTLASLGLKEDEREMSAGSGVALGSSHLEEDQDFEDYKGLDLLNDFDEDTDGVSV